ncbi:MAG: tail fiber domain-containing protein, partial [Candidatus Omnitrophota bacterium]
SFFSFFFLSFFLPCNSLLLAEDTLTITTYYPSPYGVYRELRAKRIAIGDDYIDGANYTWQETESGSGEVDFNADLVVEGNVGIGTVNPVGKLNVIHPNSAWTGAVDPDGLLVTSAANSNKRLSLTYDPTTDIGYISAVEVTVGWKNLVLQAQGGNVGIGTTSPAGALDVRNSGNSGVRMADANGNVIEGILGGALGTLWLNYTSTGNVLLANGGGNVGIGTVSPEAKLHVSGSGALTQDLLLVKGGGGSGNYKSLSVKSNSGDDLFYVNALSYNVIMGSSGTGNVGIGTTSPGAKLHIAGGDSAYALFGPNATWGGSLIVGAQTPGPVSGRAQVMSSNGNLHLDAGTSQSVYIGYTTATATYISGSWYGSSDQRLKKNIQTIPDSKGLVAINKLNPVSYTRLDNPGGGTQLGFVAQQVQSIFPELVSNSAATTLTPGGTLAINYIGLLPPIVKAIQELKKQNEILQAENKQQDARIKKLEVQFNSSLGSPF